MPAVPAPNFVKNNLLPEHPPRRVQFTIATQHRRFYLLSALACIALLFTRHALRDIQDLEALEREGKTVLAPAMSREIVRRENDTRCQIYYSIFVEGVYITAQQSAPEAACGYSNNSSIAITYLPKKTSVYRVGNIFSQRITDQKYMYSWGMGIGLCLFGLIIFHFESVYSTQLFFCKNGLLANAKILKKWEDTSGDSKSTHIEYEFCTVNSEQHQQQLQVKNDTQWEEGDNYALLYDPKNPKKHYPLAACTDIEIIT
jgi:hypothetical protein